MQLGAGRRLVQAVRSTSRCYSSCSRLAVGVQRNKSWLQHKCTHSRWHRRCRRQEQEQAMQEQEQHHLMVMAAAYRQLSMGR
jgi:hypothetical protein